MSGGFQFHLVRLKAMQTIERNGLLVVSIPFSTIKSECSDHIFKSEEVSIPFSTIKSVHIAMIL